MRWSRSGGKSQSKERCVTFTLADLAISRLALLSYAGQTLVDDVWRTLEQNGYPALRRELIVDDGDRDDKFNRQDTRSMGIRPDRRHEGQHAPLRRTELYRVQVFR